MPLLRRPFAPLAAALTLVCASSAAFAVPPNAASPVPDPGKGSATVDDSAAIAQNPAALTFLPGPEVRWNLVWTGERSPLPNRGTSIAGATPVIGPLYTGLRLDLMFPPSAAAAPYDAGFHWARWALAVGNAEGGFGTTLGWGLSRSNPLDGFFSVTSALSWRPFSYGGVSFLVRDWNEPKSKGGVTIPRSLVWGLAVRPTGTRAIEAGFDLAFWPSLGAWGGRATVGVDVPRVGRVRGDLSIDPQTDKRFVATVGLDINIDRFQVSGGGVFGDAVTASGTGFYLGAAFRSFREPGVRLPAKVVKIVINDTPGVRGHTRFLRRLERLNDDPEVEGVVLEMRAEPAGSFAHAEELGGAIKRLRARGKRVICHLEDAGGRALYVCSQADRIAMNPAGGLRFSGISSKYFYFGGLLEKLGVRADFVRIGAHKLAAEQFTLKKGSDVASLDHQELVDEIEKIFLHDVAIGRRIPEAELKKRLLKGPFIAREARAAGLVDVLAYKDEIDRVVTEVMGRRIRMAEDSPAPLAPKRWGTEPKIAIVYLHGDMIDGESQYVPFIGIKTAGSLTVGKALKRARDDSSVKAVVFRVETGGGSSLAADVILREAILTSRRKPLVVSMGSSAASGGYYASVAGKTVFADRSTITGSIGIFYGKADVVGLLDKLGVRVETFRTAPRADAESFYRPFTDDERRELGVKVKQFYDTFIARVAEGRRMKPDRIDAVARGKVWLGSQAIHKGLVDKIGGLTEAIEEARALAKLPDDTPLMELPEENDSILGFLLNLVGLSAQAQNPLLSLTVPPALLSVARMLAPLAYMSQERPMARAEIMEDTEEPALGPDGRER